MAKVVEGVAGHGFDSEAVEFGVAASGFGCFLRDIDSGDGSGSGLGAGETKATLVAEHVEDFGSRGMFGHGGVGVGDVEVESCFLGVGKVELEFEPLQGDFHRAGVGAVENAGFGFKAFSSAHGGVVAQDNATRREDLLNGFD